MHPARVKFLLNRFRPMKIMIVMILMSMDKVIVNTRYKSVRLGNAKKDDGMEP